MQYQEGENQRGGEGQAGGGASDTLDDDITRLTMVGIVNSNTSTYQCCRWAFIVIEIDFFDG